MSDLMEQMEAETTQNTLPTNEELSTISDLAQQQKHLESRILKGQAHLKDLTAQLRQIQEIDLPTEMGGIGLAEIKLASGESVTVKSGYAGSISKVHQPKAYRWMNDNGYGSLIKMNFTVKFGKGESDKANELQMLLEKNGVKYSNKEAVHASTLKAFIKEIMALQAEGEIEVPEETFSIYRWNKAEVK